MSEGGALVNAVELFPTPEGSEALLNRVRTFLEKHRAAQRSVAFVTVGFSCVEEAFGVGLLLTELLCLLYR
jgi:hypothetical protein